jgi:hypothetical protein
MTTDWTDLPQRLRAARPGDVVEVPPGTYRGALGVIDQPGVTLTSPAPGADFHAEGQHVEGKALLVVRAAGVHVHNIGLHGARVPSGNGAGIRFERGTLVLSHCRFHDNEMGLLSGGHADMQLAVHHCVFADAPRHEGPLLRHLLYVGRIGWCVVTHSRFANGWRGHLLKSRALVNRIAWNTLADDPGGAAAYLLEFPQGGDNLVLGNRLTQTAQAMNPALLSMGAEAARPGNEPMAHRLVLVDNHFTNLGPALTSRPARFVHLWPDRLAGSLEVEHHGNRFDGPGIVGLP